MSLRIGYASIDIIARLATVPKTDRLEYNGDFQEDTLTGEGTISATDRSKYIGGVKMGSCEGYALVYDKGRDLLYEGMYMFLEMDKPELSIEFNPRNHFISRGC
ncbi:hypothetical protein NSS79_33765 [Paenibacillus sp. FSL L8-0436]|uniref:hypothetical protein n=1 Tax=Paenibacillus sp. FSL L8-0436 TaxID=2954686 RepID=UPI00315856B0